MQTNERSNKQIYEQVEILITHLQTEEIDLEFLESHAAHLLDLVRITRATQANRGIHTRPFIRLAHSESRT